MSIETAAVLKKRTLPYDPLIKLPLLIAHFVGFSVWFGGLVVAGERLAPYPAITVVTGFLLLLRELYKNGPSWFTRPEGALTLTKILLLAACAKFAACETIFLGVMIACGAVGSHLPKYLKQKKIIPI